MSNLFKKLFRDIIKAKGQFITIMLVVILGGFFYTGLSAASTLLREYSDDYYEEYNLSDIWMYFSKIRKDDVDVLDNIDEIEDYELRFTYQSKTSEKTLKIHTFDKNSSINKLKIIKGTLPKEACEIAIDNEFAMANKLKIGDKLNYLVDGVDITYTVTAFIENPEYVTKVPEEDGNGFPEHDRYGIGYVDYSTVPVIMDITGIDLAYDELLIKVKAGEDVDKVLDMAEEAIESKNSTYLFGYTKEFYPGCSPLDGDIEQFKSLSYAFPVIFYIISAFMTFIAMKRIVDSQRIQIGIMKALGVKKNKILLHYISFPVLPCIIGSIIGGVLGNVVVPKILLTVFKETYDLPGIETKVFLGLVIPTIIISVIIGVLASYLSCKKILKENASASMKPLVPKSGKKIFLERNKNFWNKRKGNTKIIFRNILCNKKRTVMSCIGIIGSVALMITGFAMNDSTKELIERTYDNIYQYDGIVNFSYFTADKGNVSFTDAKSVEVPENVDINYATSISFELDKDDKVTNGSIVAIENNSRFYRAIDENLNEIKIPEDGFIVSKRLADKYGLKVGDSIDVKLTDSTYSGQKVSGKIKAISIQYLTQEIYCMPEFLEAQDVKLNPLTMYIRLKNGATMKEIKNFYDDVKEVSSVTSKKEQKEAVETYTQSMIAIEAVMIIGALLLSFAVIYNISIINIMERRSTLSTMKVLGFSKKKISSIFEIENLVVTIIGVIIGVPVGLAFMKIVFDSAGTDEMSFPYVIKNTSMIVVIILAFLFTIISNIPVRRKISKINLTEELKGND